MIEIKDADDPEKTYRAIRRFVYEFSQTEYTIRYYLAEELDLKDAFFAPVLQSYDVALLCNVAKQIIKISSPEKAAEIENLINQFLKLNEERTRVAHGLWVPFFGGGMVQHVSRSNLQPKMYSSQAEVLEKHADELQRVRADLNAVFTRIDIPTRKGP
jgi:hypothetical protein